MFLNAANFSSARKITVLSASLNSVALKFIANHAAKANQLELEPETIERLRLLVEHYLVNGDEASQLDALTVCKFVPNFATFMDQHISRIADSDTAANLKNAARELRRRAREVRFAEGDYDFLEKLAQDSGLANYGIEGHRDLKGDPPKIEKLEPFLEENRIFDIDLPYVDPDLETLQLDGNVDPVEKEYSRVTGFKYMVRNADIVIVSKQRLTTECLEDDWRAATRFLQSRATLDFANETEYDFDRTRYYSIQGLQKAQRLVVVGDSMFEVRWIGRRHKTAPPYVQQILDSFRIRETE